MDRADALGLPRAGVFEAVQRLEAELGVRLLNHTTRQAFGDWLAGVLAPLMLPL